MYSLRYYQMFIFPYENIDYFMNKLTIIFIAHRLSTVMKCDCIYEFENGEIKAYGDYNYLLKNSISFREMVTNKNKEILS